MVSKPISSLYSFFAIYYWNCCNDEDFPWDLDSLSFDCLERLDFFDSFYGGVRLIIYSGPLEPIYLIAKKLWFWRSMKMDTDEDQT